MTTIQIINLIILFGLGFLVGFIFKPRESKPKKSVEDLLEYPYMELEDTQLEKYIKSSIEYSQTASQINLEHKIAQLAKTLGYQLVSGERWEKIKK